jgi:hypothetical protein
MWEFRHRVEARNTQPGLAGLRAGIDATQS